MTLADMCASTSLSSHMTTTSGSFCSTPRKKSWSGLRSFHLNVVSGCDGEEKSRFGRTIFIHIP